MKTVDKHGTFDEAISGASDQVEEIARKLKGLIIEVYPEVVEVPWPKQRIIGYGIGPKKMSEHFCYIAVQVDYANLGFYYGAELPDPTGLLDGTGKNLQHVKVRKAEQVDQPDLHDLLQASLDERKQELGIEK